MPVTLSKTYDALIDRSASDEKARAAVEEPAQLRGEVARQFADMCGDVARQFADMRGKLTLVQGMLGVVLAACLSILFKVFA